MWLAPPEETALPCAFLPRLIVSKAPQKFEQANSKLPLRTQPSLYIQFLFTPHSGPGNPQVDVAYRLAIQIHGGLHFCTVPLPVHAVLPEVAENATAIHSVLATYLFPDCVEERIQFGICESGLEVWPAKN